MGMCCHDRKVLYGEGSSKVLRVKVALVALVQTYLMW